MFYRYSKLCIVNPHLFEASGSIDHYFRTRGASRSLLGNMNRASPDTVCKAG